MMCSRRAPELATGDFQVFVEELIDLASVEVLAIISEYNLSPPDENFVMHDFQCMRQYSACRWIRKYLRNGRV